MAALPYGTTIRRPVLGRKVFQHNLDNPALMLEREKHSDYIESFAYCLPFFQDYELLQTADTILLCSGCRPFWQTWTTPSSLKGGASHRLPGAAPAERPLVESIGPLPPVWRPAAPLLLQGSVLLPAALGPPAAVAAPALRVAGAAEHTETPQHNGTPFST